MNELENMIFNNFDNLSPIHIIDHSRIKKITTKKINYNYTHSMEIKYKYLPFKDLIDVK